MSTLTGFVTLSKQSVVSLSFPFLSIKWREEQCSHIRRTAAGSDEILHRKGSEEVPTMMETIDAKLLLSFCFLKDGAGLLSNR